MGELGCHPIFSTDDEIKIYFGDDEGDTSTPWSHQSVMGERQKGNRQEWAY